MGPCRIMGGAQLEYKLMLRAEIDLLKMLALVQVPEMQFAAVSAVQKDFRHQPVLESIGRTPLAGDERVLAQMPPGIVRQQLRPPVELPLPADIKGFVVHEEDSPRRLAAAIGEAGDVNA